MLSLSQLTVRGICWSSLAYSLAHNDSHEAMLAFQRVGRHSFDQFEARIVGAWFLIRQLDKNAHIPTTLASNLFWMNFHERSSLD